jgi:hypothetical protein
MPSPKLSLGSLVEGRMPYRDDQPALEARREELRRELDDVTRKADALADAVDEKARLARELAAVEAKLVRSGSQKLPLLSRITIASPCSASWDDMVGDDRVRFCGKCEKNVYNLSSMESAEAEALLREREGNVCVRLYRRQDGTVLTSDCPVGVRKKRVRRLVVMAAGTGAFAAAASAFFAHQGSPVVETPMMGAAVAPPPEPAATATETPKADPPPVPETKPRHPVMGRPAHPRN